MIGVLLGIVVLAVATSIGKGFGISLTLFVSCSVYLMIRHLAPETATFERSAADESLTQIIATVNTLLLVSFLVFCTYFFEYERPIRYFVLVVVFCAAVAWQIHAIPKNPSRSLLLKILMQIILLSASVRWSVVFSFPVLVGSDWYHSILVDHIVNNGRLIPSTYAIGWVPEHIARGVDIYSYFPLMHLVVSGYSLVTGVVSYKQSAVLSIGVFEIASILFVFMLSRKMFSDERLALLSALLIGLSNKHMFYGMWIIPNSLGLALFAALVYLVGRHMKESGSRVFGMFAVFLFSTIAAHPLSSFVLLLVIFLFLASEHIHARFLDDRRSSDIRAATTYVLLISVVAVLAYWMICSDFFSARVLSLFSSLQQLELLRVSPAGKTIYHYELDNLGVYFLYFLAAIGSLAWLRRKRLGSFELGVIMASGTLLLIIYASWLTGITTFLPERWFSFLFVLLVLPAAEGVIYLLGTARGKYGMILMLIVLCSLSFLMIMNSDVNVDVPLIGKNQVGRYSYFDSEMIAASWAKENSKGPIYTDENFLDYFWWGLKTNMTYIDNFSYFQIPIRGVVIRRQYIYERPVKLQMFLGEWVTVGADFERRLQSINRVYCNYEVATYTP